MAPHPFGLTLSADGSVAVTANSGTSPISISIIKNLRSDNPTVLQVPSGLGTDKGVLASVFMGLAVSPDNKIVYVAGGQENKIYLFSVDSGAKLDSIDCSVSENGKQTPDGCIGDMKLSKDGRYLYAVDQMLFRLIVVDAQLKKIIASAKTGRYPFGVILSRDGKKVYVANVGMFEYSKIGNIKAEKDYQNALDFPAFGFGSEEMKKGTRIGTLDIPGLGDPNVPESVSVSVMDIPSDKKLKILTQQVIANNYKIEDYQKVKKQREDNPIPVFGGEKESPIKYLVFISKGNLFVAHAFLEKYGHCNY